MNGYKILMVALIVGMPMVSKAMEDDGGMELHVGFIPSVLKQGSASALRSFLDKDPEQEDGAWRQEKDRVTRGIVHQELAPRIADIIKRWEPGFKGVDIRAVLHRSGPTPYQDYRAYDDAEYVGCIPLMCKSTDPHGFDGGELTLKSLRNGIITNKSLLPTLKESLVLWSNREYHYAEEAVTPTNYTASVDDQGTTEIRQKEVERDILMLAISVVRSRGN